MNTVRQLLAALAVHADYQASLCDTESVSNKISSTKMHKLISFDLGYFDSKESLSL